MEIGVFDIKRKYGNQMVLNIESLVFNSGSITGITGPNGAGKTSLLNIIGDIDPGFQGRVLYDNEPLNKEKAKRITYVFQKPYLFKRSVYENIAYPLKLRGYKHKAREEEAKRIMEKLEIKDLWNKRADRLSGGESQKVALARALVFKPEVLLLDEPTSNIDPESMKVLEREILSFNEKDKGTVIIITHNMDQAKRLCHRVVNLDRGIMT